MYLLVDQNLNSNSKKEVAAMIDTIIKLWDDTKKNKGLPVLVH